MVEAAGGTMQSSPELPENSLFPVSGFDLQAKQFLLISSPSQGKIVYTEVSSGKSLTGQTQALVDAGLLEPRGLAVHAKSGSLYIADAGAGKIFGYRLLIDDFSVQTNGGRVTIVENGKVDSVCVDDDGNLYYTAGSTNNINKIPFKVLDALMNLNFEAKSLKLVNAKELMADDVAQIQIDESGNADMDEAEVEPIVYSLYEASINPYVSEPGAIQSDGSALFWTNKNNGTRAGTVVQGETDPKLPLLGTSSGPPHFPATTLTSISDSAYGLAVTPNHVFYTTNTTQDNSGVVWGQILSLNTTGKLLKGLMAPRGLVWDGDQTAYVADEGLGHVLSFPTGRIMDNAPTESTVELNGPYGLAIFSVSPPQRRHY